MNKKLGLFRPKSARYAKLFMSFFKTHIQFRESNFELISVQQNVGNSDDIIIHLIRFGQPGAPAVRDLLPPVGRSRRLAFCYTTDERQRTGRIN